MLFCYEGRALRAIFILLLITSSCSEDQQTGTVQGVISLASHACPPPPGDLQGKLVLLTTKNIHGPIYPTKLHTIDDVDLGQGPVPFAFEAPLGTHYVYAFLDENDDFEESGLMDLGDPYAFSPHTIDIELDQKVEVNLVFQRTLYSSTAPLDYTEQCGPQPFSRETRSCVLSFVLNTVENCYPLFHIKDVDWDQVYQRYLERLQSVSTDKEFFLLLGKLLTELKDAHAWLGTHTSDIMMQELLGAEPGRVPGLSLAFLDEDLTLVTQVEADSEAQQEGFRPGD